MASSHRGEAPLRPSVVGRISALFALFFAIFALACGRSDVLDPDTTGLIGGGVGTGGTTVTGGHAGSTSQGGVSSGGATSNGGATGAAGKGATTGGTTSGTGGKGTTTGGTSASGGTHPGAGNSGTTGGNTNPGGGASSGDDVGTGGTTTGDDGSGDDASTAGSGGGVQPVTLVQVVVAPIAQTAGIGDHVPYTATAIYSDGTQKNVTKNASWLSSDTSVATLAAAGGGMGGPGGGGGGGEVATTLAIGTTTISATYQGIGGQTTLTITDATLTSIVVTPGAATGIVGSTQNFAASAIYSDDTVGDVTGQTTWVSSDPTIAAIGTNGMNRGVAHALTAGTVTITATDQGHQATATYTVSTATLIGLAISPADVSSRVGLTTQLSAAALFSDGTEADVTGQTTWESSDPAVAGIATTQQRGRVTSITAGTVTITANYKGQTATTTFTVQGATLVTVQVTPFAATIPLGFDTPFQATGVYDDNTTQDLTNIATWTSNHPQIAAVSTSGPNRGLVTPVAAGPATITATYDGIAGTSSVNVTAAKLATIAITPNPIAINVAQTQALVATGTFDDSSTLDVTTYVTWLSGDTGKANVSNANATRGRVVGLAAGATTITATRGAITTSAPITVN